jgi:hypothetical protein
MKTFFLSRKMAVPGQDFAQQMNVTNVINHESPVIITRMNSLSVCFIGYGKNVTRVCWKLKELGVAAMFVPKLYSGLKYSWKMVVSRSGGKLVKNTSGNTMGKSVGILARSLAEKGGNFGRNILGIIRSKLGLIVTESGFGELGYQKLSSSRHGVRASAHLGKWAWLRAQKVPVTGVCKQKGKMGVGKKKGVHLRTSRRNGPRGRAWK